MTRLDKALRSFGISLVLTTAAAIFVLLFFAALALLIVLVRSELGWVGIFFIVVIVGSILAYFDVIK
jgi:hypothetical protein